MRKVISIMAAVAFILPLIALAPWQALASNDVNVYQKRLEGMEVIAHDISTDTNVTRGEMADIASNMFFGEKLQVQTQQLFTDVPLEHPYIQGITWAYMLGIINGYGDGTFRPDDTVSYEQAVKILVSMAGYEHLATQRGGFPHGYWFIAAENKVLPSGVDMSATVTMQNLIYMVYRTMEMPVMAKTLSTDTEQYVIHSARTLMSDLMNNKKIAFSRGILMSDGKTYLDAPHGVLKETAIIGNVSYKNDDLELTDFIGMSVEFWYSYETTQYVLTHVYEQDMANTVETYTEDEIDEASFEAYEFVRDGRTGKRTLAANPYFVYNGQGTSNLPERDLFPRNGSVTLIDNNSDNIFDVVVIWSRDVYVVDGIGNEGHNITYKRTYAGQEYGLIIDKEDKDVIYTIKNSQGQVANHVEIGMDTVISVAKSKDGRTVSVIYSKDKAGGNVDSMQDDKYITINGQEYIIAKDPTGQYFNFGNVIGQSVDAFLDYNGNLVYVDSVGAAGTYYGYLLNTGMSDGVSPKCQIKMAVAAPLGSVTHAEYWWVQDKVVQNESISTYTLARRARINNMVVSDENIKNTLDNYKNSVVKVELDSEGEVRSLTALTPDMMFTNAEYKANSNGIAPQKDDSSQIDHYSSVNLAISLAGGVYGLAIPINLNVATPEEAYLARYRIGSLKKQRIDAYEIANDSQSPKLIVLHEQLAIEGTAYPLEHVGLIKQSVSEIIDNDGEKAYKAKFFTKGGGESEELIRGDVVVSGKKLRMEDLGAGDMVSFLKKDLTGKVTQVYVVGVADNPSDGTDLVTGTVERVMANAVWDADGDGLFNIFFVRRRDGRVQKVGSSVDNTIFKFSKRDKKIEKISAREVVASENPDFADFIMVNSESWNEMVVIIEQ